MPSKREVVNAKRIALASQCLKGISIGDAFGESFFGETNSILKNIDSKTIPATSWQFTDDTIMAIAIWEQMKLFGDIKQDELAQLFGKNHDLDPNRGYGATARRILREIGEGQDWKKVSQHVFEGMGSMGNGASMRVGPIGAFHHDNIERVKDLASKSAKITHSNIEGITGAIAVAVATALATHMSFERKLMTPNEFIQSIAATLPDSDTKSKIQKALTVPKDYHSETIKTILGNGSKIMAQDTVPFALWCAAHHLSNFEDALWKAVSVLGDRDTICAIVGGITIMSSASTCIPQSWMDSVEKYETSIFITDRTTESFDRN